MNNKCDACGQATVSGMHTIQTIHRFMVAKYSLPKLSSKLPAQFHPQVRKLESLFATLSKEFSDLESCQKQLNSITDKFIREKGGNKKKNTLDFTFCETCWEELNLQHSEVEKSFADKYSGEEEEELERKREEIDEEFEKFRTEVVREIGQEKFNQIGEELENEFLAERERDNTNHRPTIPNSREQNQKINNLEQEKTQLQAKIKELEQQLTNNQIGTAERSLKEEELANSKKLLKDKDKELTKLRNQPQNNRTNTKNNKDDNKLNWAIGLGIVAVVIGLLCLILWLKKRNKH